MNSEKAKILDMVEKGAISADEAARLLECLEDTSEKERASESTRMKSDAQRMQGKKLRVEVNGDTEKDKKINVNVSVPLVLARYVDNIIANCIPDAATKSLSEHGINLKGLNIGQIIDVFESLEEDIVNAEVGVAPVELKVRVYVE